MSLGAAYPGDGDKWRTAAGAPSIIAGDKEGGLYLNTTNGDVYQIQSGTWTLVDNIQGPAGSQGDPGVDGNDWRTAAGAPSIIAGDEEGDMYLNETNGDVYQVVSSAWSLSTNITGPTGPPGTTDHGALTGLGDDDHTQYARTDGTRNITGTQTFEAGILSDTVDEETLDAGVTVEGVLIKDGFVDGRDVARDSRILDGQVVETINIDVVEDTGAVKLLLEADGGGDLTFFFAGVEHTLDSTPAVEVVLTQGTDAVPQLNYVYVTESVGVLTLTSSTVSFPVTAHAPVATIMVQTAASLAVDGAFKVHAWTDHIFNPASGHIAHINAKLRAQPANWTSGVFPADLSGGQISTTSGVIFQLHAHTMPARDMSLGDPVWVVNDPDAAYTRLTDFDGGGIDKLSDGTAIGNNKFINIVLWGIVSEDGTDSKLMVNLPDAQYTTFANAQPDVDNSAFYAIPIEFAGTGFLIARYTLQYSTGGGGTFTQGFLADLRGLQPSTSPGNTGAQGVPGTPGSVWFVGSGVPSLAIGVDGDLYLDDTNGDVYERTPSAWLLVFNITGPTGATGAAGVDGNDWRTAAGAPSIIAGDEEGDMYLNETNGDVYQVVSSAWVLSTNITGPTGAAGDDATNFTTSHVFTFGPGADQALSGTSVTVDVDDVQVEEPGADWTISTTGEITWENVAAATLKGDASIVMSETVGTNDYLALVTVQKNGSNITGTRKVVTVAAGSSLPLAIPFIVPVVENDVIRIRARIVSGSGTGQLDRFGSGIAIVRLA